MNQYQIDLVRRSASPGSSECEYMPYSDFCQLIDMLPAHTELKLQGTGDPLLHLHFCQMVQYAAAHGMRVSAFTGLTVLPEYCAKQCVQSGLHSLYIALDAASAKTYQLIYGKPRFDRIIRNIRRLMAAKASADRDLPEIHLACTITRINLSELPELVRLAHKEGIAHVTVRHLPGNNIVTEPAFPPLHAYPEEEGLAEENPERVELYFNLARSRANKLNIYLDLPRLPLSHLHEHTSYSPVSAASRLRQDLRYASKRLRAFIGTPPSLLRKEALVPAALHIPQGGEHTLAPAHSKTSAANTEICQSDSGRPGTY